MSDPFSMRPIGLVMLVVRPLGASRSLDGRPGRRKMGEPTPERGDVVPAKIRHLPWLVCLVILMAACSGGDDQAPAPADSDTSVSTGTARERGRRRRHRRGGAAASEATARMRRPRRRRRSARRRAATRTRTCRAPTAGPQLPEDPFLQQRLLPSRVPEPARLRRRRRPGRGRSAR